MNLFDAEIANDRIVFAGGDWLPIPDRLKNAKAVRGRVALGLRPDDVYPTGPRSAIRLGQPARRAEPCRVGHGAALAMETLVFVAFGGTRLGDPACSIPPRSRRDK